MIDRKELKRNGRRSLKKHYWLFVAICLFAAFIGAEFVTSLDVVRYNENYYIGGEYSDLQSEEGVELNGGDIAERVISAMLIGGLDSGKALSKEVEYNIKAKNNSEILGRDKGVFSSIANSVNSGKIYVNIFDKAEHVFKSKNAVIISFIIVAVFIHLILLFMLRDCFIVTSRRIFLEGRIYDKVPISTFGFLPRSGKWIKSAFTMLMLSVYGTLWTFTIVGLPVKYYSYYMVPYIVAENPDIKANEAITLSRRIMKGHKWECFKIFLSFIPWFILDGVTLGLSALFYTNAYRSAVYCEFYKEVRRLAKEKSVPGTELLNDTYLFEKPDMSVMEKSYADVLEYTREPVPEMQKATGIRWILENWLGIMPLGTPKDLEYEKKQNKIYNIQRLRHIFDGNSYPWRLSPIKVRRKKINLDTPNYMRNYSVPSLIILFFVFSFIGWAWEVSLHLVRDGVFVNRGVMYGPWLPIYGSGGIMILVMLNRLRKNPLAEFIAAVILCGIVEYFTSLYLEVALGHKWWDYSGYFLNLNGRICAEGLLTFGVGAMAVVYALAPALDNLIRKIRLNVLIPVCIVLVCVFSFDHWYSSKHPNSGKGITNSDVRIIAQFGDGRDYYQKL